MKKKYNQIICHALLLFFALHNNIIYPQVVKHTAYPIVFIHGLTGDNTTWSDPNQYDIIDFLTDPTGNAPLTYGGIVNVTLDYNRNAYSLKDLLMNDVHLFTTNPSIGDLYVINFDVHASGIVPHEIPNWGILTNCLVAEIMVTSYDIDIEVTIPAKFFVGDIIRIDDEFMLVTAITTSSINVIRHILNSQPSSHYLGDVIWNLSTESNQAAIVKQGFGLKLAIDAIKSKTSAQKVILVGHSMGGLAAREYLRSYYNNDVAKIVTIGTPHYGSNLTEMPESFPYAVTGIDPRSEAVRDLRTGYGNDLGVYLFGGFESLVSNDYYSKDINCNLTENDNIEGLNDYYQNILEVDRTWIASEWIGDTWLLGPNDGIVLTESQYIYSGDSLMTDTPHCPPFPAPTEAKDIYGLMRGLDEPDVADFAYLIDNNSITKGFITHQKNNNPLDFDFFKIIVTQKKEFSISLTGNSFSSINQLALLNEDLSVRKSIANISQQIIDTLNPGVYFIKIVGFATTGPNPSYQYPYILSTSAVIIPSPVLEVTPAEIEFYDVVVNNFKDRIINITNNGPVNVSITNLMLSGINQDQFNIQGPTSFTINSGNSYQLIIRFHPLSVGTKLAQLTIESILPPINIPLIGNGVGNSTRFLVVTPDSIYNFGDVITNYSKSKTVYLKNTGSDNISISNISLESSFPSTFSITIQPAIPFDIPSGGTKQINLKFSPSTLGVKTATLTIENNSDNKSPFSITTFYGNGINSGYSGVSKKLMAYEYWFDNNYLSKIYTSLYPHGTKMINTELLTTGLTNGIHSFHIRFKDNSGQWSSVVSDVFHKMPVTPAGQRQITGYEYWFDNNYSTKVNQSVSPQQISILNTALETSSLPLGLHSFHIRYKDDGGQWSSIASDAVFKIGIDPSSSNQISAYRYWFDTNPSAMVVQTLPSPVNPFDLVQNIYVGDLSVGDHTIHLQFKDIAGQWSSVVSGLFTFAGPLEQTAISTQTIPNGQTFCYDALQKITVAGNGATFIIQAGGNATMIAGQNIIYFPSSIVKSGGYMHGYIASSGPWCTSPQLPAVAKSEDEILKSPDQSKIKVYPNPTTGNFILELDDVFLKSNVTVAVFGIHGELIQKGIFCVQHRQEFSLSDKPAGVYFIRVISNLKSETLKIIKH